MSLNVEPKDLFEFYHLDDCDNLRENIKEMTEKLDNNELRLAYMYIRTFLLR